jgi:hypothetical protein
MVVAHEGLYVGPLQAYVGGDYDGHEQAAPHFLRPYGAVGSVVGARHGRCCGGAKEDGG